MDERKEIYLFLYHIDIGGVEKSAVNFANELTALGHNVYLHPIYRCKTEKFSINPMVQVSPFLKFYYKGLDKIIKFIPPKILYRLMMRKFKNAKIDIEIAFQADIPAKIVSASPRNSQKLVWIHGIGMEYKEYYRKFDKMVFVGEDIRNHYLEILPLIPNTVLYNPIEINNIRELSKIQIPEKLNMKKFTFLSIGRLSQEKAFDKMIHAFAELNNKYDSLKDMQLLIIGSGKERDHLESIISSYNLEDKIKLLGFKKNPYKYLGEANVYVCSSKYEGFNIAITEAAALGIPVVTTDVYGSKEFLGDNNEYGIVVGHEEKELVAAMDLMLDRDLNNKYSEAIQNRFTEFYQRNRIKDIIETLSL